MLSDYKPLIGKPFAFYPQEDGSTGDDRLVADQIGETLHGFKGNVTLEALAPDIVLVGGGGPDTLTSLVDISDYVVDSPDELSEVAYPRHQTALAVRNRRNRIQGRPSASWVAEADHAGFWDPDR